MKIAIYGTEINERSESTLLTLTNYLTKKKAVISIEADFFNSAKKIKNKEMKLLEVGSTNVVRDWSFAGDVAIATFLITQSDNNNNFIIGSGVSTSISEVVEKVFSLYDLKPENYIKVNPKLLREGDPLEIVSDPSLLKSELNWSPQLSVDDLLERIFHKIK